jgi:fumarate reductase subunit D
MKTNLRNFARIIGGLIMFHLLNSRAWAMPVMPLAQVPSSLKTSVQYGLGVMFLFGFLWGVIKIWGGADRMSKGDADGKMGIVSGIVIAGAAAIMAALFTIFGMADGALLPQF